MVQASMCGSGSTNVYWELYRYNRLCDVQRYNIIPRPQFFLENIFPMWKKSTFHYF